ncbi:MAG: hypothetical protein J7M38_11580 [Armatimonadetes bacterium]|nr:hypothetical protein [Armatimonadota bacterium]
MRACLLPCIAIAMATCSWAQEGTVYLRLADGSWTRLAADTEGDAVHFTITPEQAPDGHALVVINKPDWMVLEDDTPPAVTGIVLDGKTLEPGENGAIDLGKHQTGTLQLVLKLTDDKNPIDASSVQITTDTGALPVEVAEADLPLTRTGGTLTVALENIPPGEYRARLQFEDMSPQRNRADIPLALSVYGVGIGADGQSVRLAGAGSTYELLPDGQKFVTIGDNGPSLYLTTSIHGQYYYVNEFAGVEELSGVPGLPGARINTALRDIDKKPATNEEAGLDLSFDVGLMADTGCLLVSSYAKNIGAAGDVYCFWGWLPGDGYITPDGERHEWTMEYKTIGRVGWVFLPPKREGERGVGWISPGVFGESRFGTMILYTDPSHIPTETGEEVVTHIAVMPADSAEEVAAVAEKLEQLGWPEEYGPD